MTTAQGGPVVDDQNTLRVGARGPLIMDDFHYRGKMFHFDHERIPERVVHARGYGAHGFFETYESLEAYTRADLFQRPGEKTPVFVTSPGHPTGLRLADTLCQLQASTLPQSRFRHPKQRQWVVLQPKDHV